MSEREWENQAWGHTYEDGFSHGTHDSRRPGWGNCLAAGCLGMVCSWAAAMSLIYLISWWRS